MRKIFAAVLTCLLLTAPVQAAGMRYILLDSGGFISVFEDSDLTKAAIETKICVRSLPQADQDQLKEGIIVEGDEALLNILEDLGS